MTTFHFRQGDVGPSSGMVQGQTKLDPVAVLMSIEYVQSREAAERIYLAERRGLNRPLIISKASRRMDDFTTQHIPTMDAKATVKEN